MSDHAPTPHHAAPTHLETIGVLLDRMAASADRALLLLTTDGPRSERMRQAWWRLGELELRYADLADAVAERRRRLPEHPRSPRRLPRSKGSR
ncbi:hypothetical protein [Nocardia sp. BMG51109]|uniref:hypothetical protein n=1 Tax=Nocardia sp. BMG51109 TaxID=1056816 RepID=UPI00350F905D